VPGASRQEHAVDPMLAPEPLRTRRLDGFDIK
jgi:hypothetical protein